MKKFILAIMTCFSFSNYCAADLLEEYLNDPYLYAIHCNDLNYNHDSQRYNLDITFYIENKEFTGVNLQQDYGQEEIILSAVDTNPDLQIIQFSDYTLEFTEKKFLAQKYWANFKQPNSAPVEVLCSFGFVTFGE